MRTATKCWAVDCLLGTSPHFPPSKPMWVGDSFCSDAGVADYTIMLVSNHCRVRALCPALL